MVSCPIQYYRKPNVAICDIEEVFKWSREKQIVYLHVIQEWFFVSNLLIMNFKDRSAIAKFRSGITPICLETEWYEYLNVNEKICPISNIEVESEEHVLIRCDVYTDFRDVVSYACIKI